MRNSKRRREEFNFTRTHAIIEIEKMQRADARERKARTERMLRLLTERYNARMMPLNETTVC